MEDPEQIKGLAVDFYKNLLGTNCTRESNAVWTRESKHGITLVHS